MHSFKVFWSRLREASLARMNMHIREIHKESGRARIGIFLDMLWCVFRYNVGYLDYHVFGFAYVRGKEKRRSFMTMNDNLALVRLVNEADYRDIFRNKLKFWTRFAHLTGRDYLNLRESGPADLAAFLEAHDPVFAKPAEDFGGHGIRKLRRGETGDAETLYRTLREAGTDLIEEAIVQHPDMDRLNPSCINTLRMVTLVKDGEAHLMYSLIRVGDGTKPVDNISSGGMYAPVWEDGKIAKPAFCDATGLYYETHPKTGTRFEGFEIPNYPEAAELVKQAALVVDQIKYVGWDVALSVSGPVLVEGNVIPGYDMCQNYRHLRDDKRGILEKFQAYYPLEKK